MPEATVNGLRLVYTIHEPEQHDHEERRIALVCGTGQPAYSWDLGVLARLLGAGYRVLTFDNRGMPPSEAPPPPYSVEEMAKDAACLIEHVDFGPCVVMGYSLGSMITQELALARPDLVERAVMMGTVGRTSAVLSHWIRSVIELEEAGIKLPAHYQAVQMVMQLMSPITQRNDDFVNLWVELTASDTQWEGPGIQGQYGADLGYDNRLEALSGITQNCLVVGFEHDIITPPHMTKEVADAIPNATHVEFPNLGHLGLFEDPGKVLDALMLFIEEL
jgi:pimeloyl-ACP methyl ester carboxylesterase